MEQRNQIESQVKKKRKKVIEAWQVPELNRSKWMNSDGETKRKGCVKGKKAGYSIFKEPQIAGSATRTGKVMCNVNQK